MKNACKCKSKAPVGNRIVEAAAIAVGAAIVLAALIESTARDLAGAFAKKSKTK
ncbi:MAG: hypothetical protein FWD15_05170 [Alphaproteobacteria bacterium]|nr:hypothetical protein [Alphaproteobacteria bacterium]